LIVAVLGAGKIGEAVARGLSESDDVSKVIITKRNISTLEGLRHVKKIEISSDNKKSAQKAEVILVAVKAADGKHVLREIAEYASDKIVISLMAAISIKSIQNILPTSKIVRAMPNIAATIGEAITAFAPDQNLTKEELEKVRMVFGTFGDSIQVPESLMDAVTALSGSGPAYIAVMIESMVSAGLKVGMPRDTAFKLATKTLTGTANLLSAKGMHPAELRDSVTTPAGTTIAGLYELEKGSFRTSIMNAVEAATLAAQRSLRNSRTRFSAYPDSGN
jgi:pyrroline-5-carboxylate reductase